ncbi:MAG: OmpA family protein [Hahellaceae bacterium]|nr:OmpA family protein [Hahellaceae bacterium]
MKKVLSVFVAGATLALGAGQVLAEEASGIYVNPMAGYYMYDGDRKLDDDWMFSLGVGYKFASRWAAEVAAGNVQSSPKSTLWNVDGLYHLTDPQMFRPFLIAGVGSIKFKPKNAAAADEEQVNAGLGVLVQLVDNLSARAEVRALYGNADDSVDAMTSLGLSYLFGHTSKAKPVMDSDGDGVADDQDQCASTAAGTAVDAVGCPLVVDADGDGVKDNMDRCPGTASGVKVDASGCPVVADADNDGVADERDQCPGTAPGTPVDATGCLLDTDKDGVTDAKDACPNTPKGALVEANGCTKKLLETVSLSLDVKFASGKTDVPPAYRGEVEKLAQFLTQYPDTSVVVEGHTDDRGADKLNQRFSQLRADAVRRVLVGEMGIAAERVTSVGYGESRPIADNATAEGRQKNRRVVAVVSATVEK